MVKLMDGIALFIQTGCFALSALFIFIGFGAGRWWETRLGDYELDFTLWKLCSKYKQFVYCIQLVDTDYHLKPVILAARVFMSMSVIFIIALLALFAYRIFLLRIEAAQDLWLRTRTILFLFLQLSLVIVIAHSHHCPPCYVLGDTKMETTVSWGWSITVAAFFFLLIPTLIHVYKEISTWYSNRNKI